MGTVTFRRVAIVTFLSGTLFVLATLYCASGYAANISFSLAHPAASFIYRRRALMWLIAAVAALAGAIVSFIICFVQSRVPRLPRR
jgi:hypothetical protein